MSDVLSALSNNPFVGQSRSGRNTLGDPTADGIHDRLVHNAHRIEMGGDSMRKNRGKPNA